MLARRFLAHHRDAEPVVLVVTDGEPTAHLEDDGTPFFCWPPMPETIARTVAEVERVARTRRHGERVRARPRARAGALRARHRPARRRPGVPARQRAARRVRGLGLPAGPPGPPGPLNALSENGAVSSEALTGTITIERVDAATTYPLRAQELRQGRPVEIAEDDAPDTLHLAARIDDGEVVGVRPVPPPRLPVAATPRARGSCAAWPPTRAVRGLGAGRALVAEGLARLAGAGRRAGLVRRAQAGGRVLRADGLHRGHRGVRPPAGRPAPRDGRSSCPSADRGARPPPTGPGGTPARRARPGGSPGRRSPARARSRPTAIEPTAHAAGRARARTDMPAIARVVDQEQVAAVRPCRRVERGERAE